MSPEERARLLDIMSQATVHWRWGVVYFPTSAKSAWHRHDVEMLDTALRAAETAGFAIVPPDDGR